MTSANRLRNALRSGASATGSWVQIGSPEICEIVARCGFDFVIIDMEHGSFGLDVAVNMIRAVEPHATPILRVPDAGRTTILKVLDAGARGIIVPNVSSRAEAEAVVSASRFAPLGTRGACPATRATGHGLAEWSGFVAASNDEILVIALIETPEGVSRAAEIVTVPGLDAIGIGPFDLSQAMGYAGDWRHPAVQAKQAELIALAREAGREALTAAFDSDPAILSGRVAELNRLGSRLVAVSGDRFALTSTFRAIAMATANPT
ncbi:HpcH/HpaI aldolase family protein [Enterovirga rhinocerotis]|uniref:4-hydroxy-2-oxoheptanedioate aldolase n=1 Tax=Enterovirga rhinocerotis TaxID=1339210 RepID=A0A4V3DYP7_9HYPH|nr:aldolase/citrate lyase family protein [Enterovirga rhinocerotis]TDR93419.1 4-hydroxy-2-oxoheptanedioate aldolase [Enterovirga rhinocerotis]